MQIPIVSGIYADTAPDLRTAYPVNMRPVPKGNGVSAGYLRPEDGIIAHGTGPGTDRGGINWNGTCYRVMGSKLVSVASDGTVTTLGDVGNDSELVTFDYSFDRLAIASNGNLFYWNGSALTQVTDPDLGTVNDMLWVDGYFMTTDGEYLVVTDLNDPTAVNPLKYGSSEADPDPVNALLKLRNEVVALNRHTIEIFDNVGGSLFPFARITGAQIEKGCVGSHACCIYLEQIAFLGSGWNEAPSVYIGNNGVANPIATQEVATILEGYTEAQLASAKLEARKDGAHEMLYVHLPDRTLVYDAAASAVVQQPVWWVLVSTLDGHSRFRACNFVYCYDKWLVGDPASSAVGYFDDRVSTHWGSDVRWEFSTQILYNEGRGALFHELELVALTGSVAQGTEPVISTEYSVDGVAWSVPRTISAGTYGERAKRLVWFGQGYMENWRVQRFRSTSAAHLAFMRLEGRLEPLAY